MILRFFELTSDQHSSAVFESPEISRALSKCHDSAPGLDGLRCSTFQQHLPWWRAMLLDFCNLSVELECGAINLEAQSGCPVFKDGDPVTQRPRPIPTNFSGFLCVLGFPEVDARKDCPTHLQPIGRQSGRSMGVFGLVDVPVPPGHPIHTFAPSLTFGRLLIRHGLRQHSFVCTSLASLVACGAPLPIFLWDALPGASSRDVSPPWVDTGIAQGRVLSPLLFNLLLSSLAAAIRRASPGVSSPRQTSGH